MIDSIFNLMFRCRHSRLSRPLSTTDEHGVRGESYLVCLECGARFSYDAKAMRVGKRIRVLDAQRRRPDGIAA